MIDWDRPLQFEDGIPALAVAQLSRSGKSKSMISSDSEHADVWAECYDMGVRYIVVGGDGKYRFPYSETGAPVDYFDSECGLTKGWKTLMNVPQVNEASMDAMAENDLWGMF